MTRLVIPNVLIAGIIDINWFYVSFSKIKFSYICNFITVIFVRKVTVLLCFAGFRRLFRLLVLPISEYWNRQSVYSGVIIGINWR